MRVITSLSEWKRIREQLSGEIGFVPTMGCLHAGHKALVEKSVNENAATVVSIYVNPTQFNNPDDLVSYPKTEKEDCALLELLGVDYVLMPSSEEMYPEANTIAYHADHPMATCLEGTHRPGHFDGMLTVVMKWLCLVRPSVIYMGDKDYQQHVLVQSMIRAYHIPTRLGVLPTQREESGLPLSSRLKRLSALELEKARFFAMRFHALKSRDDFVGFKKVLEEKGINLEYLEMKDHHLFVAVYIESVRLIDHRVWKV